MWACNGTGAQRSSTGWIISLKHCYFASLGVEACNSLFISDSSLKEQDVDEFMVILSCFTQ